MELFRQKKYMWSSIQHNLFVREEGLEQHTHTMPSSSLGRRKVGEVDKVCISVLSDVAGR